MIRDFSHCEELVQLTLVLVPQVVVQLGCACAFSCNKILSFVSTLPHLLTTLKKG